MRNVQGQTHIKDNFNFVNDTHSLRQSDIVDYRAAYFAANNIKHGARMSKLCKMKLPIPIPS